MSVKQLAKSLMAVAAFAAVTSAGAATTVTDLGTLTTNYTATFLNTVPGTYEYTFITGVKGDVEVSLTSVAGLLDNVTFSGTTPYTMETSTTTTTSGYTFLASALVGSSYTLSFQFVGPVKSLSDFSFTISGPDIPRFPKPVPSP